MDYKIGSDMPGRIRLRCGKYAFSKEDSFLITHHLSKLHYVDSVKVSYLSGSILIYYNEKFRQDILSEVLGIDVDKLENVHDSTLDDSMNIDLNFKERLYKMLIRRIVHHFFLPVPIRNLIYIHRSLRFMKRGINSLLHGSFGVEVLDGSAVSVSIFQGHFNTASSIMFLLGLSELLEDYTHKKTRNALSESLAVNIDRVWIEKNGEEISLPISSLSVKDRVIIRTGSMIPIDGVVFSGEAEVNQSSMTGEPIAIFKKPGDSVFAGTVVEDGKIIIEVHSLVNESRISKIIELIESSENLKASIHSKAEHIADTIVPFSFLLSLGVFVFTRDWHKALSVLLVDYSCAIKLATPISVVSSMREASTHKIMVKGGKYLEAMAEADTIVFDKTGTLTVAKPHVNKVVPFENYERDYILRTAACLEEHFPHSVASAIVSKAQEENLHHEEEHAEIEYIVAHGIATTYQGKRCVIGSYHFVFEDENVEITKGQLDLVEKECLANSVIYLGIDGKAAGFICISDPPRKESKEVISSLRELGIKKVIMLTGDGESTAKHVANSLGIDEYRSQVLPEDKAKIILELKDKGHKIIMVGDGVNDSPALSTADVSISMKDSSDIAREVSDIALLSSYLYEIVTIRKLSQLLIKRIKNNFKFIVYFNTILLLLGLQDLITPNTSAVLHNISTMFISAKSMTSCLKQ